MNTWSKQYHYGWGYWAAMHPFIKMGINWNPDYWRGFVNGTVDRYLVDAHNRRLGIIVVPQ